MNKKGISSEVFKKKKIKQKGAVNNFYNFSKNMKQIGQFLNCFLKFSLKYEAKRWL